MSAPIHETFARKRVLVTGGLGFIGSHLAHKLVEMGAEVCILDSLAEGSGANRFNLNGIESQVRVVIGDVRDAAAVTPLLVGQNFLFNLAGQTSHLGSLQDPLYDLEVNALSPLKLLEHCREHNPDIRIVFAGTRQVYGRPASLPVNEQAPPAPIDYNGVSKLAGELYHLVCSRIYGLWTTVLRLTNIYGPHMRVIDARQNFVGWWFRQIIEGQPLEIYGSGQQVRDLLYVDDTVDAFLLAAAEPESKGMVYNLGGYPLPLRELAQLMTETHGTGTWGLVPFPGERLRIDIGSYAGDYSLIRSLTGWEPKVDLQDGIARTIDFYRRNREHYW
jgi:UDP-glucose 4-epimerase